MTCHVGITMIRNIAKCFPFVIVCLRSRSRNFHIFWTVVVPSGNYGLIGKEQLTHMQCLPLSLKTQTPNGMPRLKECLLWQSHEADCSNPIQGALQVPRVCPP